MARGVLAAAVACAALARMPVGVTGQKNIGSYDYIVVGSGPGGATVANYLTLTKKHRWANRMHALRADPPMVCPITLDRDRAVEDLMQAYIYICCL